MIRLVLIIFLFLLSLLAIFKAPAYYLWLMAIGVTEYALIFVGITALLLLSGIWVAPYRIAGNIIGMVALVLFLSPIVRAYVASNLLKNNLKLAFGVPITDSSPILLHGFSFAGLFKTTPKVDYRTITYANYSDINLTMDYYTKPEMPEREELIPYHDQPPVTAKPCVIVVHGGSWAGGDSQQLPELNWYLANKGYNVVSINYRMAPKYQTPAPVEDVCNAIAYLCKHANELHIDTNNLVLLGRSAGAQIALLAAYTLNDPRIKGVVDFYGPADMVWGYSIPSNPLIMDSRKVMENYIGGSYKQVPEKYVACSPIEFVDRKSVPTLIIHGENDVLVSREHSRRLDLKLQQNGVPHYWLKLPWATHGFDFNLNGPGGQLSTYAVETFLKTVTK